MRGNTRERGELENALLERKENEGKRGEGRQVSSEGKKRDEDR